MLSTTISVRPRVFIITPIAMLWRHPTPASLAGMALPRNLPPEATRRIHSRSVPVLLSWLRSMDSPVTIKKSGSSTRVANGSILLRMVCRKGVPWPRGKTRPKRKEPSMAWKPTWCTNQAESSMPMRIQASRLGDSEPVRA